MKIVKIRRKNNHSIIAEVGKTDPASYHTWVDELNRYYSYAEWEEVPTVQDVDVTDRITLAPIEQRDLKLDGEFIGGSLHGGYKYKIETETYVIPDSLTLSVSEANWLKPYKTTALRIVQVREGQREDTTEK